ncbi:hypothetical protein F444_07859, partial [Phytophthora nicotianae P1976]
ALEADQVEQLVRSHQEEKVKHITIKGAQRFTRTTAAILRQNHDEGGSSNKSERLQERTEGHGFEE